VVPANIISHYDPLRAPGNNNTTIMNNVLLMSYKFNIHENNTDNQNHSYIKLKYVRNYWYLEVYDDNNMKRYTSCQLQEKREISNRSQRFFEGVYHKCSIYDFGDVIIHYMKKVDKKQLPYPLFEQNIIQNSALFSVWPQYKTVYRGKGLLGNNPLLNPNWQMADEDINSAYHEYIRYKNQQCIPTRRSKYLKGSDGIFSYDGVISNHDINKPMTLMNKHRAVKNQNDLRYYPQQYTDNRHIGVRLQPNKSTFMPKPLTEQEKIWQRAYAIRSKNMFVNENRNTQQFIRSNRKPEVNFRLNTPRGASLQPNPTATDALTINKLMQMQNQLNNEPSNNLISEYISAIEKDKDVTNLVERVTDSTPYSIDPVSGISDSILCNKVEEYGISDSILRNKVAEGVNEEQNSYKMEFLDVMKKMTSMMKKVYDKL